MKRMFLLVICMVFTATASYAQEQPEQKPAKIFRQGSELVSFDFVKADVATVIKAIGEEYGLHVIYSDGKPDAKASLKVSEESLAVALAQLLNPVGYQYELNGKDKVLTIWKQGNNAPKTMTSPTVTAPNPQPLQPQPTPAFRGYSYSAAVLPDNYTGGPTWLDLHMEELRQQEAQAAAYRLAVHNERMAYGYYLEPPSAYTVTGYPAYPISPWYAERWRAFENRGREGALKTTGNTKDVELYVDGCYIGDANQFDSWWDQKSILMAGKTLTITARRRERAFSRTVIVPSVAMNFVGGAKHLPFGIHNYDFTSSGSFAFDQKTMDSACRESPR